MSVAVESLPALMAALAVELEQHDFAAAWKKSRELVLQNVRDNFTSSATPEGASWPPRKVVGDGHPLLIDTGRLLQASVGNTSEAVNRTTPDSLTVGVRGIPYAAVHQFGGRKMPQREYFGAGDVTLEAVAELLADEGLSVFAGS